jgi:hypothetical protein
MLTSSKFGLSNRDETESLNSGESRLSAYHAAKTSVRSMRRPLPQSTGGGGPTPSHLSMARSAVSAAPSSLSGQNSPYNVPSLSLSVDELLCIQSTTSPSPFKVGDYLTAVDDLRCRSLLHLNIMLSAVAGRSCVITTNNSEKQIIDVPPAGGYRVTKDDMWTLATWGKKSLLAEASTNTFTKSFSVGESQTSVILYSTFDTAREKELNQALAQQLDAAKDEVLSLKRQLHDAEAKILGLQDDLSLRSSIIDDFKGKLKKQESVTAEFQQKLIEQKKLTEEASKRQAAHRSLKGDGAAKSIGLQFPEPPSSPELRPRVRGGPKEKPKRNASEHSDPGSPDEFLLRKEGHLLQAALDEDYLGNTGSTASMELSIVIPPPPPDFTLHLARPVVPAGQSVGVNTPMNLLSAKGQKYELREVFHRGVCIAKVPFSLWGDVNDSDESDEEELPTPARGVGRGGGLAGFGVGAGGTSPRTSLQSNKTMSFRRAQSSKAQGGWKNLRISEEERRLRNQVERLFLELKEKGGPKPGAETSELGKKGPTRDRAESPSSGAARRPNESSVPFGFTPSRVTHRASPISKRSVTFSPPPPSAGSPSRLLSPPSGNRAGSPGRKPKGTETSGFASGNSAASLGGQNAGPPPAPTGSIGMGSGFDTSRVAHILQLLRQCEKATELALLAPLLTGDELLTLWRLQYSGPIGAFHAQYVPDKQKCSQQSFDLWTRGRLVSETSNRASEAAVRHWLADGAPFTAV